MRFLLFIIGVLLFSSCAVFQPKLFNHQALNEKLVDINRDSITLKEILKNNKGKKTFIQIFATYCPVSQDSFDDVIEFQKNNSKINYIFLSVDHSYHDWKRGLENIKVKGNHYYIPKKGKGQLGEFFKLKTIPRFLILDKNGKILLYKSSSVSDRLKNKID